MTAMARDASRYEAVLWVQALGRETGLLGMGHGAGSQHAFFLLAFTATLGGIILPILPLRKQTKG